MTETKFSINEKTRLLLNPVKRYNIEDDGDIESTDMVHIPLLGRRTTRQKTGVNVGVIALCFLLIGGVSIGLYLLAEQDRPWPINIPFDLVDRNTWGSMNTSKLPFINHTLNVLIMHTRGKNCWSHKTCTELLKDIQQKSIDDGQLDMPYNFLISDNGETYEGRGWSHENGFKNVPFKNCSLTIGFIGNFTINSPTQKQIHETKALITESIRRKKLIPNYNIFGVRNITESLNDGDNLFNHLTKFHKWKHVITLT